MFIVGQIFFPWVRVVLVVIVTGAIAYIVVFSENIYCELDGGGVFHFFQKGRLRNSFELGKYRIGCHRKTEQGIFGDNNIKLQIMDDKNEETFLDMSPLGTTQFNTMFAAMQKHAIQEAEVLKAGFYVIPGSRIIEMQYTYNRPGIIHKNVMTTYGPVTKELQIESGKSYILGFDRDDENFTFEEFAG